MRKPITRTEWQKIIRKVDEALRLASVHDPDHELRLAVVEHRLDRIEAPRYRTIRKGKPKGRSK